MLIEESIVLPLTNSETICVLVDKKLFDQLALLPWMWLSVGYCGFWKYESGKNRKLVYLHRKVLQLADVNIQGRMIDHVNQNPADNRLENLRVATKSQNMCNRIAPSNNTSGYKGVSFHKQMGKWRAYIKHDYKQIALGLYWTKEEAALAYNKAAQAFHGEFAHLNEIK